MSYIDTIINREFIQAFIPYYLSGKKDLNGTEGRLTKELDEVYGQSSDLEYAAELSFSKKSPFSDKMLDSIVDKLRSEMEQEMQRVVKMLKGVLYGKTCLSEKIKFFTSGGICSCTTYYMCAKQAAQEVNEGLTGEYRFLVQIEQDESPLSREIVQFKFTKDIEELGEDAPPTKKQKLDFE